jgi:hypothetical protein
MNPDTFFSLAEHDDPPQKTNPLYRTRSEGVHDTTHLGRHVHARSPGHAQGSEVGERLRDGQRVEGVVLQGRGFRVGGFVG